MKSAGSSGTVHSGQVEDEISLRAVERQPIAWGFHVALVDCQGKQAGTLLSAIFAVTYGLEGFHQIAPYETLGTGHKNLHY